MNLVHVTMTARVPEDVVDNGPDGPLPNRAEHMLRFPEIEGLGIQLTGGEGIEFTSPTRDSLLDLLCGVRKSIDALIEQVEFG